MSDRRWKEIFVVLETKVALLDRGFIQSMTREILDAYEWMAPTMEGYCKISCPSCTDPCCDARQIFYNQTDMLCLAALGISPPPGQTRIHPSDPCRYLTPTGCRLPRIARPYVCVWYLCEAQTDLFQEETPSTQRRFISALECLRVNRLKIESLYEGHFAPLGA